ncbi:MAG: SpoVG family protein [Clostridia bacterium]|nr:SpoVG family protein [Clostridia bacterium]
MRYGELIFKVSVTTFEKKDSNIRGLARIFIEDSFVIGNVSLLEGKNGLFVAMPSYKTKQTDKDGKSVYQDVCYPITKEFREKLYDTLKEAYEQAKEQKQEEARGAASNDTREQVPDKDTPLR